MGFSLFSRSLSLKLEVEVSGSNFLVFAHRDPVVQPPSRGTLPAQSRLIPEDPAPLPGDRSICFCEVFEHAGSMSCRVRHCRHPLSLIAPFGMAAFRPICAAVRPYRPRDLSGPIFFIMSDICRCIFEELLFQTRPSGACRDRFYAKLLISSGSCVPTGSWTRMMRVGEA